MSYSHLCILSQDIKIFFFFKHPRNCTLYFLKKGEQTLHFLICSKCGLAKNCFRTFTVRSRWEFGNFFMCSMKHKMPIHKRCMLQNFPFWHKLMVRFYFVQIMPKFQLDSYVDICFSTCIIIQSVTWGIECFSKHMDPLAHKEHIYFFWGAEFWKQCLTLCK